MYQPPDSQSLVYLIGSKNSNKKKKTFTWGYSILYAINFYIAEYKLLYQYCMYK